MITKYYDIYSDNYYYYCKKKKQSDGWWYPIMSILSIPGIKYDDDDDDQ